MFFKLNNVIYNNKHGIETVHVFKYLGLYIDDKLKFKEQLIHVKSKLAQRLYILHKVNDCYSNLSMLKTIMHLVTRISFICCTYEARPDLPT